MSDVTLKPCPFCSGEAKMIETGNRFTAKRQVKIKCTQCRVTLTNASRINVFPLREVSVTAWNTRTVTPTEENDL